MENKLKIMNISRFLSLPLGLLMYVLTRDGFGDFYGQLLGMIAMLSFYFLVSFEQRRFIVGEVIENVKQSLNQLNLMDTTIGIKQIKKRLLVCIYLMESKVEPNKINAFVVDNLSRNPVSKYVLGIQIANLYDKNNIEKIRELITREAMRKLTSKKSEPLKKDLDKSAENKTESYNDRDKKGPN